MQIDRIGKLRVLAELGSGAGSRVYHVRREADRREYALKVVSTPGRRSKYLEQARNEFRVGQLLDHPNLAGVFALETETDWLLRPRRARLLLEYVPGWRMDVFPRQPTRVLLRIFEQVADALAHMHERGVCHGDLKPSNLMFSPASRIKIIDFGLARVSGRSSVRVQGTPEYMAPETADRKLIDERTDIYNFGATMYRLVAGRPLPPRVQGVLLSNRSYERLVIPVGRLNAVAPPKLCDLVHWCIQPEPDDRPAAVSEIRAHLRELIGTKS